MLVYPECRDGGVLMVAQAVDSTTVHLVGRVVVWLAVPARATLIAFVAALSKENPIYQAVQAAVPRVIYQVVEVAVPRVIYRVAAVGLPMAALVDCQADPD